MAPTVLRRLQLGAVALALGVTTALSGPAPATAVPTSPSTIQAGVSYPHYGQRGAEVRALQNQLIAAGLLKAELNTGYYGTKTKAAVKALQKASGLKQTGKVNAATAQALAAAVKAATGPATWYEKETIGHSAGGRKIVAYRAGEAGKPVVMVVATMHGEENFGQYVANGLLEGKKIADVDLWVVPVLNPDGLAKDRRWISGGVDLNRNFSYHWIRRAHTGPKAKSAKETRVIMHFLNRIDPKYLVSWHQPLHGVDSDSVKNRGLMRRLAKNLDLPKKPLVCGGTCHGTMSGWFNHHHDGAAITVEYGSTARSMNRMKGRDADAVLAAIGGRRA
jgi:protein MpaA